MSLQNVTALALSLSSTQGTNLQAALDIQSAVDRTSHFLAAGTAIFVYDYALTFSDEMHYVWGSRRSTVMFLFLLNRYGTPLLLVLFTIGVSGFVRTGIEWNGLIAIRVHALYERRRMIGWFLAALFFGTTALSLGLAIHNLSKIRESAVLIEDLKVCTPGLKLPKTYWSVWIPSIMQETMMFAMTMFKLLEGKRLSVSSLRTLLIRDGFIYYCALMCWRVANMVMFIQANPTTVYETMFCFTGFGSALVSRLVLNLRSWADQPYVTAADLGHSSWIAQPGRTGVRSSRAHEASGNDNEVFNMHDLTAYTKSRYSQHQDQDYLEDPAMPYPYSQTTTRFSEREPEKGGYLAEDADYYVPSPPPTAGTVILPGISPAQGEAVTGLRRAVSRLDQNRDPSDLNRPLRSAPLALAVHLQRSVLVVHDPE
ncbi:hypothetical protein DL93DRAFT_2166496 [Clavulina sp. PMI_390]|nr:hypothetical protein DL93DRAFT_2166496 [Clavulina sp. PMI_390]